MGFVPTEKLTAIVDNKYEAILIAAREARVRNSIAQLSDWDPDIDRPKITSVALDRLTEGHVDWRYGEENPEASPKEESGEDDK